VLGRMTNAALVFPQSCIHCIRLSFRFLTFTANFGGFLAILKSCEEASYGLPAEGISA
jgi:hypothetical protein